jgi:hypothetical protein
MLGWVNAGIDLSNSEVGAADREIFSNESHVQSQ